MEFKYVSAIMTKNVVVANLHHKFSQVQELFINHHIHHLPVVDGDTVVGIIGMVDLLKAYHKEVPNMAHVHPKLIDDKITIEKIMTSNPVTVESTESVGTAAKLFSENSFHSLPVLEKGKLVGILTTNDIVRFTSNQFQKEGEEAL